MNLLTWIAATAAISCALAGVWTGDQRFIATVVVIAFGMVLILATRAAKEDTHAR